MSEHIYLDYNATTPVLPEVADAVREASLRYGANPESQHGPGREARRVLEEARERVGELLGAQMSGMRADRVLFTSGGTEAANLAVFGLSGTEGGRILVSAVEHPCVGEAAERLPGFEVERLAVGSSGVVEVSGLREKLCGSAPTLNPSPASGGGGQKARLVSVMLANNETGVLQPLEEIAAVCAEQGVLCHTDAAQAVGKVPVDFAKLGVAALSCTAHKFCGPLGIGALVLKHGVQLEPTLYGGHQQAGLRPGTEMVALAVGMQTALESWHSAAKDSITRITELRDRLERTLMAELPFVQVNGAGAERLPNTSNLAFEGMNRQALVMALDQEGVACSTGSACASGSSESSPVLLAMGLKKSVVEGSIRLSLGPLTTAADIDEASRRILIVCKRLRGQ